MNFYRSKLISKCLRLYCTSQLKERPLIVKSKCQFSTSSENYKWFGSSQKPFKVIKTFESTPTAIGVEFQDSLKYDLNYIWLRDNCQCEHCLCPNTKYKMLDTVNLDPNIKPKSFNVHDSGLEVVWEELNQKEHISFYESVWLHRYCLGFLSEMQTQEILPLIHPWDRNEVENSEIQISYDEVMNSEDGFIKFLYQLYYFGLVIIRDAPPTKGKVVEVVQKFSDVRDVKPGHIFQTATKRQEQGPGQSNYNKRCLDFCNDLNHLEKPPGIQAMHCLEAIPEDSTKNCNDRPGQFYFVDGFFAAKWLRVRDPESFFILASVPVQFQKFSPEMEFMTHQYIITLATGKGLSSVHFDNKTMAPIEGPGYLLEAFYKSYKMFGQKLRDLDLQLPLVIRKGDIVVFDNHRILHARSAADDTLFSEHIEVCFGEMDQVLSRMRYAHKQKRLT